MVKKKQTDREENTRPNQTETSDNKEDRTTPETGGGNDPEATDEDSPLTRESENSTMKSQPSDTDGREEESAMEKLAEMQDRYLRLSAEFDNYRKRTLREKIELSKYAGEDLLLKLLPVLDDFERAISHMDTATDTAAMKEGIDLIHNKFTEFLKQNSIKEIDSLNCQFDVDLHDAVAKIPVPEDEKKGLIVDVIQKGYFLHDKVIRHSKVVVGE
jgi:molecular chaperone GrpE